MQRTIDATLTQIDPQPFSGEGHRSIGESQQIQHHGEPFDPLRSLDMRGSLGIDAKGPFALHTLLALHLHLMIDHIAQGLDLLQA